MKQAVKLRRFQLPIAFLLLLINTLPTGAIAKPVLTLAASDALIGLYHSEDQTALVDELVKLGLQRIGYELKIITVPSQRSLMMAQSGLTDGTLLRTHFIEKQFPTLIQVPESLIDATFVIFSRKPIQLKNSWESLSGKSVGLVIGMKLIEQKVPKTARITRVKNERQLFSMLRRKRIDHAAYLLDLGNHYLNKNNISGIVLSDKPLMTVPGYVYLHPKHKDLAVRLANSIKNMKKDGSFQKILDRHK